MAVSSIRLVRSAINCSDIMAHKFLSSVPSIYKQGAGEDKGDVARLQAFIGAIAIGDLVKSTLGRSLSDDIVLWSLCRPTMVLSCLLL